MLTAYVIKLYEKFINIYYECAPKTVKKVLSPPLLFVKYRVLKRMKHLSLPLYVVKGKEKSGGADLTILFLGDENSLMYLSDVLFQSEPYKRFIDEVFILKIDKKIKGFKEKVDAVIVETDRFFSRFLRDKGFIVIPAWVDMVLDTSKPLLEISKRFKKSARDDIRIIRKQKYSYEISTESEKFELFYHKIRLPYLTERLGKLALPDTKNYWEIRDIFERHRLLLVKKGCDYVSGTILASSGELTQICYMGILSDSQYLKKGAGSALYYFSILWAKENDVKLLDFGSNRSFFSDGAFRYKRKWGADVRVSSRFFDVFGLKVFDFKSKAVHDLLINNPFPYIDGEGLKGAFFLDKKICSDEVRKVLREYYTPGLSQISIFNVKTGLKEVVNGLLGGCLFEKTVYVSFDKEDVLFDGAFDSVKICFDR